MTMTLETGTSVQLQHQEEKLKDRYQLRPLDNQRYEVVDASGKPIGTVRNEAGSGNEVELFNGKGGFMVTVRSKGGLRYFGLPGSRIELSGTDVELIGEPVTANPAKPAAMARSISSQSHTPQATILGAGLATRFERISGNSTNCSKPGVPLSGEKTVIEHIANNLARHNFSRLIINTYFKPASLKASLSRSEAKEILYIDESEPSGTAGGLRKMLLDPEQAGKLDESKPLLVVQGDAVTDADFSSLMNAHVASRALVTIGCQIVDEDDVDKFGIIVTDQSGADGQSGLITGFQEKPNKEEARSRLGNTGFYIFAPKAYAIIREIYGELLGRKQAEARNADQPEPQEAAFDFATDIFPEILRRTQADPALGGFRAESISGYWSDIGNPKQYLESVHDLFNGKVDLPLPANPGRYYRDGVIYWEGTQETADAEGARLLGNVVVARPFTE